MLNLLNDRLARGDFSDPYATTSVVGKKRPSER
jgi:hypothetical protein